MARSISTFLFVRKWKYPHKLSNVYQNINRTWFPQQNFVTRTSEIGERTKIIPPKDSNVVSKDNTVITKKKRKWWETKETFKNCYAHQSRVYGMQYLISCVDPKMQSRQKYSLHQNITQVSICSDWVDRNLQGKNKEIVKILHVCHNILLVK